MGVCLYVSVEGVTEVPVERKSDGKTLAWLTGHNWDRPEFLKCGMTRAVAESLLLIDGTAYGDDSVDPASTWQDPTRLGDAFRLLRNVLSTSGTRLLQDGESEGEDEVPQMEWIEEALGDAIRICEWAQKENRRVALVAS